MRGEITMEKKTIGKFISALRKANGMTQKELGEKLFVSDKTVSRWECDECTPELSLIPSIAEIFGITTDELLRGERNNPDRETADSEDKANKQKAKSDKQFKLMLHSRKKKFTNLSFISIGLIIVGLIAAMICNLGFSKGLLGFCLASVCFVASIICQTLFLINSLFSIDEDDEYDDESREDITEANTSMLKTAVAVICGVILLWAFCLPIVVFTAGGVNFGLDFDSWLPLGLIFSAIAFIFEYVLWHFLVKNVFVKNGYIILTDEAKKLSEIRKRGVKTAILAFVIALCVLSVAIFVIESIGIEPYLEKLTFETVEDFEAFTKQRYDEWFEEGYGEFKESMTEEEYTELYESQKQHKEIERPDGSVLVRYYHSKAQSYNLRFDGDDLVPITVITQEALQHGRQIYETILCCLYGGIAVAFIVSAVGYTVYVCRKKHI